jgi:hypothetical protein
VEIYEVVQAVSLSLLIWSTKLVEKILIVRNIYCLLKQTPQ